LVAVLAAVQFDVYFAMLLVFMLLLLMLYL
jgi:hypothetical protein